MKVEVSGYTTEAVIGEGGMAKVYRAVQDSLGREVALKVMSPELIASDRSFCDRFLKEGKIIARLRHQNIVTIHDIGCAPVDLYYMSMEFCAGGTLKDQMRSPTGAVNPMAIMKQIATALDYAHSQGFVHRDIKPGNILFRDDGTAVLSDFGIAKTMDDHTQFTQSGLAIGTPEYMSPEQAVGAKLDGRSDFYSLGIVLFELLVGQKPFSGPDAVSTALMQVQKPVPRLPHHLARWQYVIDRLMAKRADDRFADGHELNEALNAMQHVGAPHGSADATRTVATQDVAAAAASGAASKKPAPGTSKLRVAGLIVLGLGIAAVAGFLVFPSLQPEQSTGTETQERVAIEERQQPQTPESLASTALTPETRQKRDRLLRIARAHKAMGRLRLPVGSNALEAYRLVLDIDPANREAQSAIAEIERLAD